jgi:hypothetical protein
MKFMIACASLVLGACSMETGMRQGAQHVMLDGKGYLISQLTAGTWTATSAGLAGRLPATAHERTGMLAAIERVSGCKVTDSDYSRQGLQLDAQVDCGEPLKN